MVRRYRRKDLSREQAAKYARVANSLYRTARDLNELADEGDTYGNAIGIVAVHAAIAYADTLCIEEFRVWAERLYEQRPV